MRVKAERFGDVHATTSVARAQPTSPSMPSWGNATMVAALAPAPPPVATAAFVTQVTNTVVTNAAPPPPPEKPALVPAVKSVAPTAANPAPSPAGIFLRIAAVRSQAEAYALTVRVTSQHGTEFGTHRAMVTPTVDENLGKIYRVRLGPYPNANEPQELCNSLRTGGYDCVVE